jgi:hypothetical protein
LILNSLSYTIILIKKLRKYNQNVVLKCTWYRNCRMSIFSNSVMWRQHHYNSVFSWNGWRLCMQLQRWLLWQSTWGCMQRLDEY